MSYAVNFMRVNIIINIAPKILYSTYENLAYAWIFIIIIIHFYQCGTGRHSQKALKPVICCKLAEYSQKEAMAKGNMYSALAEDCINPFRLKLHLKVSLLYR